jgi:hypothetical protein
MSRHRLPGSTSPAAGWQRRLPGPASPTCVGSPSSVARLGLPRLPCSSPVARFGPSVTSAVRPCRLPGLAARLGRFGPLLGSGRPVPPCGHDSIRSSLRPGLPNPRYAPRRVPAAVARSGRPTPVCPRCDPVTPRPLPALRVAPRTDCRWIVPPCGIASRRLIHRADQGCGPQAVRWAAVLRPRSVFLHDELCVCPGQEVFSKSQGYPLTFLACPQTLPRRPLRDTTCAPVVHTFVHRVIVSATPSANSNVRSTLTNGRSTGRMAR